MSKNIATPELVARYMKAGVNIMLIGDHGVGKTSVVRKACEILGYKIKEYNGALMEPYIDLIGIPDVHTDESGEKVLSMVNQHDLRDADVVFIDEYNRARVETKNATMTMVNDHQLNGEDLPHLKSVVAACNPPESGVTGDKYSVGGVDPAQMDRFTIKLTMSNRVDTKYLISALGKKNLAKTLAQWQHGLQFEKDDSNKNTKRAPYVSPRTVERLGKIFIQFPEVDTVWHVLGDDAQHLNTNSLAKLMLEALNKDNIREETLAERKKDGMIDVNISELVDKNIKDIKSAKATTRKTKIVSDTISAVMSDIHNTDPKDQVDHIVNTISAYS